MNASELIKLLQAAVAEHGDLEVMTDNQARGGITVTGTVVRPETHWEGSPIIVLIENDESHW